MPPERSGSGGRFAGAGELLDAVLCDIGVEDALDDGSVAVRELVEGLELFEEFSVGDARSRETWTVMTVRPHFVAPLRLLAAFLVLVVAFASGVGVVEAQNGVAVVNVETPVVVGADRRVAAGQVGSDTVLFDDGALGCCVVPNRLIVDSNAVYGRPGTIGALRPGEVSVVTRSTPADLANDAASGKFKPPGFLNESLRACVGDLAYCAGGLVGGVLVGGARVAFGPPVSTVSGLGRVASGVTGGVRGVVSRVAGTVGRASVAARPRVAGVGRALSGPPAKPGTTVLGSGIPLRPTGTSARHLPDAPQTTRPLAEIGPAGNPGAFPPLSASTQQLQHTFKHADDFGVTGNWNKTNGQALQDALDSHVGAPGTRPFSGTYRGDPVVHHLDPQTRLNVIQTPSGELVSGWRLSPDQLRHVLENGKLGGG